MGIADGFGTYVRNNTENLSKSCAIAKRVSVCLVVGSLESNAPVRDSLAA